MSVANTLDRQTSPNLHLYIWVRIRTYLVNCNIGSEGCKYLGQGNWPQLFTFTIGRPFLTKERIKLRLRVLSISAKASGLA